MEVKRATVQQQGWVELECDRCRTRYSCLVEECGVADTGLLGLFGIVPSDQSMQEAARHDLRAAMKRAASRTPCPKCGTYAYAWVEALQQRAGKIGGWLSFICVTALLLASFLVFWPEAPAWIFLIILAFSWLISRVAGNILSNSVNPNRDLGANRQKAQQAQARGVVRIDAP